MLTFTYKQAKEHSQQERDHAKDEFIAYIGIYQPEFEKRNVVVLIDMDPADDKNKYHFTSTTHEVGGLIWSVQDYRKKVPFLKK